MFSGLSLPSAGAPKSLCIALDSSIFLFSNSDIAAEESWSCSCFDVNHRELIREVSLDLLFAWNSYRREELPYHNSENENLNEWNKVDGSRSSRVKFTKPVCDKIRSSVNKSFPMSRVCDPDLLSSIVNEFRMPYGIRSRESIVDTEGSDKPLAWECPLG